MEDKDLGGGGVRGEETMFSLLYTLCVSLSFSLFRVECQLFFSVFNFLERLGLWVPSSRGPSTSCCMESSCFISQYLVVDVFRSELFKGVVSKVMFCLHGLPLAFCGRVRALRIRAVRQAVVLCKCSVVCRLHLL
jgi:hypothetical protein